MNRAILYRWIVIFCLLSGISCSPEGDEVLNPSKDIIYYDYYSDYPQYPRVNNDSLDCKRVCFDVNAGTTVWMEKNDKAPNRYFITGNGVDLAYSWTYSKSFIANNVIIKIFPSNPIPSLATKPDVIYFQKIDKSTGAQLMIKPIITAAEFPASGFYMSQVVTDGTNYFFSLSNSTVYCFNGDGNLVWKKGGYPMTNTVFPFSAAFVFGYTYIYHNAQRIYVVSNEPVTGGNALYCLNSATGDLVWAQLSSWYPPLKELLFTDDKIINHSRVGAGSVLDKTTGNQIGIYSGLNSNYQYLLIPVGNTHATYTGDDGRIGYIRLQPTNSGNIGTDIGDCPLSKNFIDASPNLYSAYIASGRFVIACLDLSISAPNHIVWKKILPLGTGGYFYEVYDYFLKDKKLYLFTNFQITNGTCAINPQRVINGAYFYSLSLIVLDATNGEVTKQIASLPSGKYFVAAYNISHD